MAKAKTNPVMKEFGFDSENEFYDAIYENVVDGFDAGYETQWAAYMDSMSSESQIMVSEVRGKYLVWVEDEMSNGDSIGYLEDDISEIFSDKSQAIEFAKDTAKVRRNSNYKPLKETRDACRNALPEEYRSGVWFSEQAGHYPDTVDFRIYYDHMLVAEHTDPDPQFITDSIKKFFSFQKRYKIEIFDLHKEHPWNSNDRYYVVGFYDSKKRSFYLNIPIWGRFEGRKRSVADVMENEHFSEFLSGIAGNDQKHSE